MRPPVSILLPDEAATIALGRRIAALVRPGDAVLLEGELGAGKTTLARALVRAFRRDELLEVPSPSYTLVQDYGGIAHLDLWRLGGPGALEELGWRELRDGIVVVEWPDRLGRLRPPEALTVVLSAEAEEAGPEGRRATLVGWPAGRLAALSPAPAPSSALLLAAGFGTRMRPLTEQLPKPLLPLGGRALIDRTLDRLAEAGIGRVVVNAHWQADRLAAHLDRRPDGPTTVLLREDRLLRAGGTAVEALRRGLLPSDEPFLMLNGDSVWFDGPAPAIRRLIDGFDPERADGVLLLARTAAAHEEPGTGDFLLDPGGRITRPAPSEVSPFLYAGLQIVSPALFRRDPPHKPEECLPLDLGPFWDRAIGEGRLGGQVHDGDWFHLSTPADLDEADRVLRTRVSGNGV